jgi:hypothetical protein
MITPSVILISVGNNKNPKKKKKQAGAELCQAQVKLGLAK